VISDKSQGSVAAR